MMTYEWKEGTQVSNCLYYFQKETGLIVGQVHMVTHTNIWVSKIYKSHTDEHYLGQYITLEFAKKSIENYIDVQSRTLLESDF
jgi:hypothetical protein